MADDTEKVSVNMGAMDLAHIDLLVEKTFYKDRTDFFRTAARNQIDKHSTVINSAIEELNSGVDLKRATFVWIGSYKLDKQTILRMFDDDKEFTKIENGELMFHSKLIVVGKLSVSDEVDLEFIRTFIKNIKVFGIFKAANDIKKFFS